MPRSCRSIPEPPPSSATVTMAVRLRVRLFSPRSMVDSPVPPPMATILGPAPPFHSVIVSTSLRPRHVPVVLRGLIALLLDEVG